MDSERALYKFMKYISQKVNNLTTRSLRMQHLNTLFWNTDKSNLQVFEKLDSALLLQPSSLFLHSVIPLEHFIQPCLQNVATGGTKKMIVCIFLLFLKLNKATAFEFAPPECPSLLSSQIAPTK